MRRWNEENVGDYWQREADFWEGLIEQLEAAEKGLREMHDYLSGIVAAGFIGECDWDDFNSWLAKHERYATYVSSPASEPPVACACVGGDPCPCRKAAWDAGKPWDCDREAYNQESKP